MKIKQSLFPLLLCHNNIRRQRRKDMDDAVRVNYNPVLNINPQDGVYQIHQS